MERVLSLRAARRWRSRSTRIRGDWRWCERALELGCLFSINPDAHSTEEIDNIQWGVLMARKGAVMKERVINALGRTEFRAHLESHKKRRKLSERRTKAI
jgi:DNA polymerase (family 10)